jgi:hypothetical protein
MEQTRVTRTRKSGRPERKGDWHLNQMKPRVKSVFQRTFTERDVAESVNNRRGKALSTATALHRGWAGIRAI